MIPAPFHGVPRTLAITVSTAVLAVAAQGCESAPPEPDGPMNADTYVDIMGELADLKRFPPPGTDYVTRSARADSARQAVLDRHGVTVEELLDYAERLGSRPELMLELTDRIIVISDSLARTHRSPEADSTHLESGAADSVGDAEPDTAAGAAPAAVDTALRRIKLERLRERFGGGEAQP